MSNKPYYFRSSSTKLGQRGTLHWTREVDAVAHQSERHSAIRLLNHIYVVDRILRPFVRGNAQLHGDNTPETRHSKTFALR